MRRVGVGVRRRHDAGAGEAVGAALPLEQEKGEVRGEADGWARGHCAGRQWFYSDSNQVQMNSN
jgi:hypothetical protein